MNTLVRFQHNKYYHIFNRTNHSEPLFRSDNNREYFLSKIKFYLSDFVEIYAYSLLENHFHLSISIKSDDDIILNINKTHPKYRSSKIRSYLESTSKDTEVHVLISSQFRKLFISYTKSLNRMYNRSGNLFNRAFKRSVLDDEKKITKNIYYIHHNARLHGIVSSFTDHKWNSYHELISDEETFLSRNLLFDRYGGRKRFIEYHNQILDIQ